MQTSYCYLSGFESFLEVIKQEEDDRVRLELMGIKLKPVKA